MRSHLHLVVVPVVVLAGLASVAGCSTASRPAAPTSPTATSTTATSTTATSTAAGTSAVRTGGDTHLTAYTDNDGPTATVILAGAVGDYGKAQSVNPDGSVNTEHDSQFNLALTHGSFRLDIAALDKKFTAVLANLAVNSATCSGTASVHGAVPVVTGSGTGAYRGIGGTFDLTITLDEVYRTSACSETGAYLSQSIVITGPGSVSFGATGS